MADFRVGDRVSWNSEAGRVTGVIKRKLTAPERFKTYTVRASKASPQYLIQSEKTDHLAMHQGGALRRLAPRKARATASSRARRAGPSSKGRRAASSRKPR